LELASDQEICPPFDLTADMLFVVALVPRRWLRKAFAQTSFFSLFGRTPLVLWFSRISEGCYRDRLGEPHCLGGPAETLYNEVNVMALLRKRRLFCPAIWATSELSVRIARMYGMPKEQVLSIEFDKGDSHLRSAIKLRGESTMVAAKLARSGGFVGWLVSRFLPVWTWPVEFPSGRSVKALVLETPRVRRAKVNQGKLELPLEWIQKPISFIGPALYVPRLRMQLPPP
jgi:hypothetical protein